MDGNLRGRLTQLGRLSGTIAAAAGLEGHVQAVSGAVTYTGETEVTPTEYTQTLYTRGLLVPENITINPIPTNYGLITWNGSVITVS